MPFRPLQQFNGLLDRMVPQDNYGGLLSPQDQHAAAQAYRAQLGASLLSAAGPQRMPVSLGQALGAAMPAAAQARDYRAETGIRNDQIRRQIDNENRQKAAQQKLGGLFRGVGGPDGEMLGILADIDPGLAMQVAMSSGGQQQAQDPSELRMMDALGIPRTPEGYAQLQGMKADDGLKPMMDALSLQMQGLQLENLKRAQAKEDQEAHETRVAQEQGITRGLDQTQKIASLTKKLEGTALASGLPGAEWRRAGVGGLSALKGALGLDTDEMRAELAAFDEQKKNLSDQLNNLIAGGQLENVTDAKLKQYQNSLADQNTQPAAIMEIQSVVAQSYLDQADRIGYKLPNREKYETAIEEMRNYVPGATETVIDAPAAGRAVERAVVRVADIGRMGLEQLQELDPDSLSKEVREAAADRWDELNK
jgi:hypothetical protein